MDTVPVDVLQIAARYRAMVDEALASRVRFANGCPERLAEAIRYSLLAPGKRLRPILALMAAEACGGRCEAALPAACAVEMVHAYSLIHDDLPAMDDDDLRRGRLTCHRAFGEATAILAGDALLTLAFETLAEEVQPPQIAARCCSVLAQACGARGMVGGQTDDMAEASAEESLQRVASIHARKTGALIIASLRLGALVAGADELRLGALAEYGRHLGLAFQITDDLLDVRGDAARVGKRLGKDSERGKATFPALLGIQESHRRAERLVEEACDALGPLEGKGAGLEALARRVLERNR